jgi:hypothetical protein
VNKLKFVVATTSIDRKKEKDEDGNISLFGKGHKKVQQELSESVSKKRPK